MTVPVAQCEGTLVLALSALPQADTGIFPCNGVTSRDGVQKDILMAVSCCNFLVFFFRNNVTEFNWPCDCSGVLWVLCKRPSINLRTLIWEGRQGLRHQILRLIFSFCYYFKLVESVVDFARFLKMLKLSLICNEVIRTRSIGWNSVFDELILIFSLSLY